MLGCGAMPLLDGGRDDAPWLTWGAALAVTASTVAALWDGRARVARGGLYAAGVILVLLGVARTTSLPGWDVWQTPVALAGYAACASLFALLAGRATRPVVRMPGASSPDWLLTGQAVVAAAVLALGVRVGLTSADLAERLASPAAIVLLTLAAVVLLRAVPAWAAAIRYTILALGVLVVAAAAWAGPDPHGVAPWLHRNAWLAVAFAAAGTLGSEAARRVRASWGGALRTAGGVSAGLAVVAVGVNLAQQVPVFDPFTRHTPLGAAAVFAVLAAVAALVALAVRFALDPERDPLRLPARRRTGYVYLAEVLVVLFFVHVRFNVPELFLGTAVKYWTFAVMALAFVGVGLAEFFERRRLDVLAAPLRRTGVLLPLVPLLAFWAKPPAALTEFAGGRAPGLSPLLGYLEKLPRHLDTYAWLWVLAGALYGLVALSRKSFGWALLAALATNAALWSLLAHTGAVPFFVHPQAWVVPLALIVLVSEHVNRGKLRPDVSNGLRYLGVGMIYGASAADMFIAGVGQSVWLPVVLAVFCVCGVLAGVLMRVKAFVLLGIGFLLLDVFAMIWHAAVDLEQTWVWYASGIVLGVAILTLFAVFEKRRGGRDGF